MKDSYIELETYLLMDKWEAARAFLLLAGADPDNSENDIHEPYVAYFTLLSTGEKISPPNGSSDTAYKTLSKQVSKISRLWLATSHATEQRLGGPFLGSAQSQEYSPKYFVEWAATKRIKIPWLQHAIDNQWIDLSSSDDETPARESTKPYQLIEQLIKMVLPDADLNKPYKVHEDLNKKLKGGEILIVSNEALKTYLSKS